MNIKFSLLYKELFSTTNLNIAYLILHWKLYTSNNFLWYNLSYTNYNVINSFCKKDLFFFDDQCEFHVEIFFFLIAMRSRRKKTTLPFRKRSINPRDLLANLCAPFNYRGALPPLLLRVNWVVASIIRTSEYRPYRWGFTALICGSAREFLLTL